MSATATATPQATSAPCSSATAVSVLGPTSSEDYKMEEHSAPTVPSSIHTWAKNHFDLECDRCDRYFVSESARVRPLHATATSAPCSSVTAASVACWTTSEDYKNHFDLECDRCDRYFVSENAREAHMWAKNHFNLEGSLCNLTWLGDVKEHEVEAHFYYTDYDQRGIKRTLRSMKSKSTFLARIVARLAKGAVKEHEMEGHFYCASCDETWPKEEDVREHEVEEHFYCATWPNEEDVKEHEIEGHFYCSNCHATWPNEEDVKEHEIEGHFYCSNCHDTWPNVE
ncbi:hypothetical protein GE09DRAFT_1295083, partial [Coniochaeta sp. 2T2.1]